MAETGESIRCTEIDDEIQVIEREIECEYTSTTSTPEARHA
jgi:hypothetical protein